MDIELVLTVLRLGVCGTFVGHGLVALLGLEAHKWGKHLSAGGWPRSLHPLLFAGIGSLDILVGLVIVLGSPPPLVLAWAACWACCAALIRPLAGEPLLATVERSSNFCAPLALLLLSHSHSLPPLADLSGVWDALEGVPGMDGVWGVWEAVEGVEVGGGMDAVRVVGGMVGGVGVAVVVMRVVKRVVGYD